MEDLMCKQLFYQVIVPRIQNTQQKCKLQLFSQIILYHYCGFLRTAEKAKELELWVLEKSTWKLYKLNLTKFMENIFIPEESFGFPKKSDQKGDRTFHYNWLELFSYLFSY